MTHAFMYPRVTQIAPRAHSVPASSLGAHLRPTGSAAATPLGSRTPAPGRRS